MEFDFSASTQMGIVDINLGNAVYTYISQYFSSHKFSEDDLSMYGNSFPLIVNGTGEVSRNKYICLGISTCHDIDRYLEYKKDLPLMSYSKIKVETISIQREIQKLEDQYNLILSKIQKEYSEDFNIQVEDISLSADSIINKNVTAYISKSLSHFARLTSLVKILVAFEKTSSQEYILYLNNVETYLYPQELAVIKRICHQSSTLTLIVGSTNPAYLDFSEIERINFLVDDRVEQLPGLSFLLSKLNNNFARSGHMDELTLVKFLDRHCFKLLSKDSAAVDFNSDYPLILDALLAKSVNVSKDPPTMETCLII